MRVTAGWRTVTQSKSSPRSPAAERPYWLLPPLAALVGLALLYWFAPRYLFHQGFPLDDSWIHAVYARELARSWMMAYNPGIPATGETAPLWPVLLAVVHRFTGSVPAVVAGTKLFGFLLHALACMMFGVALAKVVPDRRPLAFAAAALVAIHPHLVAAAVSGMEVPLGALVIAGVLAAAIAGSRVALVVLGAAAIGARPEIAVIAVLMPLLFWISSEPRRAVSLSASSLVGAVVALALLGVRSRLVSGFLLPATFYAKASHAPFNPVMQEVGFVQLLGRIPLLDSLVIVVGFAGVALVLLRDRSDDTSGRAAAALYLSGLAFCAVSFALVPPVDPPAFYHQRYVLPGVIPMLAAMPMLLDAVVRGIAPAAARVIDALAIAAMAAVLVLATPARARHLSNDAQNIDDVQVAFGQALAAAPATSVAWVVDAGASRFFGKPFVLDTIGLNTPQLLGPDAQAYMDAHEPAYLDVFPGWSSLESDPNIRMAAKPFEATTPYTVTSAPSMRLHLLVACQPPGLTGRFVVCGRPFAFRCARR